MLLVSAAAVTFSITQGAIKVLSKTTCIFQIFCVRSVFFCTAMYLMLCLRKEKLLGEPSTYTKLTLRAISASLGSITIHFSTHLLPLVDAVFLVNSYLMTTALLSFALGLESLSWKSWVGVIGCILGNALILRPPFIFGGDEDVEWDVKRIVGVFVALLSTLLTSTTGTLTSMLGTSISSYGVVFSSALVVFVMSFPFVIFSFPKEADWTPNLGEVGLYLLVVFAGIIYHLAYCRGFQIGQPTKSSIIFLTNMLYSALFGVLVLSDHASWYTLMGALLIIISAVLICLDKSNFKPCPNAELSREPEEELLQF